MRILSNFLFVGIFAFSTSAFPASFDSTYKAQRVSLMLTDAVSGKLKLDTTVYQKEDQELLAVLKDPTAQKIKVLSKDNQFIIDYEGKMAAMIEFTSEGILLNGSEFKLNPSLSLTQNLRNWALASKKSRKTSKLEKLWQALFPTVLASAPGDQAWEAAKNIVVTGMDAFQTYASSVYTSPAVSAAVARGAAAGVVSSGLIISAAVVGSLALLAVVTCDLEARAASAEFHSKKSQELLNCYSKPLSWIGANPRDRLYVQNLDCHRKDTIVVEYESQTHKKIDLVLSYINGRYMRSMPKDQLALDRDPKLEAEYQKWFQDEKLQKRMEEEAVYFKKICEDPKMLETFRKASSEARKQGQLLKSPAGSNPTGAQ